MSFDAKTLDDLIQIADAGGGFRLNAHGRSTDDLIRIADAAGGNGARIYLRNVTGLPTKDLIRIAGAGEGAVFFED